VNGTIYGPHPEGLTPDDVDAKRRSNPTYDAFVADYEEQKGKEPQQTPGDFMSKYGLTKEQFDAMPDVETPTAQAMRYTP
jgi:hypothetical protein